MSTTPTPASSPTTIPPNSLPTWATNLEAIIRDLLPLIEQAIPIIAAMTAGLTAKDITTKTTARAFRSKLRQQQHDHGAHSQLVDGWDQASENHHPLTALLGAEMAALSGKSGETRAQRLFVAIAIASALQMRGMSAELNAVTLDQVLQA